MTTAKQTSFFDVAGNRWNQGKKSLRSFVILLVHSTLLCTTQDYVCRDEGDEPNQNILLLKTPRDFHKSPLTNLIPTIDHKILKVYHQSTQIHFKAVVAIKGWYIMPGSNKNITAPGKHANDFTPICFFWWILIQNFHQSSTSNCRNKVWNNKINNRVKEQAYGQQ